MHYLDEGPRTAPRRDGARQPDLVVLLPPLVVALRDRHRVHRARPHRLRALGQARRSRVRLHPRAPHRGPRRLLDRLPIEASPRRDPGGARLGRHDRHGLGASDTPSGSRASCCSTPPRSPCPTASASRRRCALARTPLGALLVRGFNAFARAATRVCVTKRPMSRGLRRAYVAPYDGWDDRIATLRFVQDIPLRPGDRAVRSSSPGSPRGCRSSATPPR